ncbi:CaiB/BaiF CoA transferase family protein [Nocardioides sp.]|uniref:CaiB/BaiF CoA transferase family protein n=1 Tax=Nocardioides sp. TaxID=35761 RepID=UPI003D11C773
MNSALEGIRVLDLSELLPGPFLTSVLSDLGAEVVKLERPGGDPARSTAPGLFAILRQGKQAETLDLKSAAGRAALEAELSTADVLVDGFRPGVLERLGFGREATCAAHPRLVYVSISGFGQTGPMRDAPGHDITYAAANGVLSLAGPGDLPSWNPGLPIADLASSLYAAVAVLAALRERDRTGRGGHLDVGITACLAHWLNPRIGDFDAFGLTDRAQQRAFLQDRAAYGTFISADGVQIAIAAMEDHFWSGLVKALGLVAWKGEQWSRPAARRRDATAINAAITRAVSELDSQECLRLLDRHGVPAHRVLDVGEAIALATQNTPDRVDHTNTPPRYTFPVQFH